MTPARVLLTGWFSFLRGEVTAGDALAADVVGHALRRAGLVCDTAWSPAFRPDALHLDALDPARYTHLVFACGPVHSRRPPDGGPSPLLALHDRFPAARRIAVGVSVPDPDDPAVRRFHTVLPRDGTGRPAADLSLPAPVPPALPLVGVVLTGGQHEYGARRRHAEVSRTLGAWLAGSGVARLPLDTRLDSRDWRLPATPDELHTVLARLDAVVTTRLHGLVLALRAGTPALAVDPVEGGAKVSAQAAALGWPAVLRGEELRPADFHHWLDWCLSDTGRARARAVTAGPVDGTLLWRLLAHLPAGARTGGPAGADAPR
ncbi:polysaccharide pyruvyl transferase family protein [Streptomyces sp. RS10V-4]|uniref:polysaccharide pyruvyl transferase family protein n=1 Tax=Streptomyces rhizoryzae TaxID=2932493 RepID=UPI002006CD26|nr:polysaccharide pyruvyl transferase family protein [Streptomyces rhizoryzae]MCK7624366.1 polysaccharide pyruvyl transferase family protein [Streptomyces rhizoryzae]